MIKGLTMDITPENIIYNEIIGLPVETVSPHGEPVVRGIVVDESRNMVVIKTDSHEVKVAKASCSFIFTIPDGRRVKVLGTLLQLQPENRIPKKKRSRGK